MKLRSTTPVSKKIATRVTLTLVAALTAVVSSLQFLQTPQAYADVYDDKIAALNRQVDAYNEEAQKLARQADTLQRKLSILANQKAAVQARIDVNQAKHDKLQRDIAVNEQKITENRNALGETLADMSIGDKITPLEMLASSNTIADFIDKQEQRATIRDSLSSTITEIKALKAQLEKDKAEVAKVLDEQKAQRGILASKEQQQAQLLAATQNSESRYKSMISNKKGQIEELRREAAAVRAAMNSGANGVTGGSAANLSGYRYYPNGCAFLDDGYGYYRCQCVSYVAHRLAADPSNRGYSYLGNAEDWWDDGKTVSAGNVRRGDVIVWLTGSPGHVMFVEGVSNGVISYTDFNGAGGPLSPGQGTVPVNRATSYPMKVIRFN